MKRHLFLLLLALLGGTEAFAQSDFYGVVRKSDTTAAPIYLAKVVVFKGTDSLTTLKTYFDGGFKLPLGKNSTYSFHISYAGYKDSTFTVITDKKGIPDKQNVTIWLKKDGMRLVGVIKNREDDFPVKDACIILKNILTRDEKRIYTGIDGAYNFRMDFEANYKVTIDKRSIGIFNRFKDTSFYISTIGFNLPYDYKLDILLDPLENPDPYAQPPVQQTPVKKTIEQPAKTVVPPATNNQPFVAESEKVKSANETVNYLQEELAKAKKQIEELKKKESELKKPRQQYHRHQRPREKRKKHLMLILK